MNEIQDFDCVQFQREVREKMLKEANYDLKTLAENIRKNLDKNELYLFLKDRKEKHLSAV
jgi:hypothetical protein